MATQAELNISEPIDDVETYKFDPIQGEPMLHWKGKRPFESTQFYPAQLKETHGEEVDGWRNKIYWGDNLQVMSYLLKTYRGKINLIYIDPPFDSKADYKKRIELRDNKIENDRTAFEEKQYTDIWTNDEYLQFMYERLILMRELLADNGSIYLHCDWRMNSMLRLMLDEVFGPSNYHNEIIWQRSTSGKTVSKNFSRDTDSIYWHSKSSNYILNPVFKPLSEATRATYNMDDHDGRGKYCTFALQKTDNPGPETTYDYVDNNGKVWSCPTKGWRMRQEKLKRLENEGRLYFKGETLREKSYWNERKNPGKVANNLWEDISNLQGKNLEMVGYPTQKPEALLERIIKASSNPGDLVFDCFMGSGTTQSVAMKLGCRFIGADINLGAVETTTKRLLKLAEEIQGNTAQEEIDLEEQGTGEPPTFYTGFEVYNVNHYDVFRNPAQAKDLLIEALEIQPLQSGGIYDGEKDGRMVKIMPINRIATRADLNELIAGFDYQAFVRRQEEHPTLPVEKLLLVCMGHEPDLAAALQNEVLHKLDIEVVDILRDKSKLEFKRESKAKIVRCDGHLIIEQFYPMNLLQKLSLMEENVEDWRELVESVKVDFNYDGAVLNPSEVDIPEDGELVKDSYPIPEDAGTIRVKITDLLSESLEETLE